MGLDMYNLLVSGNDEAWTGEPWILETGRCAREYTDSEITKNYGDFASSQVEALRRFPCIFAYEIGCKKDPKFGILRDIVKRQGKVKIEYELVDLDPFITHDDILDLQFELDISDWEMSRTHWAIKDVNLPKALATKGVHLPRWARNEAKAIDITAQLFDVAFSFPGEVRNYVESVAGELERLIGPDSYFYDNNYKAQLARPSMDTLLQDIYRNRSRLIVVFLCEKYQEKEWCGIEFRAIREIIKEREHQRVMFIKMDEGKVDGVFSTDGYIDGRTHTPREVADFIQERVSLLL
jgi:TIR domain